LADTIITVPQPCRRMEVVNSIGFFQAFVDTNEIVRKRIWVDEIHYN
jgi:hypothetical protein